MVLRGVRGAPIRIVGLALALAVTGCADEDPGRAADEQSSGPASQTPSSSPSDDEATEAMPPNTSECADVWTVGATLPRGYQGCVGDGAFVERDVIGCSSGQRMAMFADRFYGVLGGTVREAEGGLADDPDYRDAVTSCRA